MRIIDCFPYNGESIALFRLAYLFDAVDEFIIVEAAESHVGEKKNFLYLDKNDALLKPFESKITRLVIERFPDPDAEELATLKNRAFVKDPAVWFRETYQRNFPGKYLRELSRQSPWVLMACDVDEIPRREIAKNLRHYYDAFVDPHRLEMLLFYYSSEWIKPVKWYGAFIVNDQGFKTDSLDDMRVGHHVKKFVFDAGWHFSYFMTDEEIQRKVKSMAHTEFNTEETRALEWIRECKKTGLDLYRRGGEQDCQRYAGNDLPETLRAFELEHGIRI